MRFLAVADIHGNATRVRKLVGMIPEINPNLILIAGDLTHFSGAEKAKEVLEPLLNTGIPILAVHGNCDGRDVPAFLEELGISAHDKRVEINGVGFVGVGGSNMTPFNTIWELTEDEISAILGRNYRDGDVILSHVPPRGTRVDRVHSGLHVGSEALKKFIEERQPPLVVTGHIHEARAVDRIGDTVIVNPGPLFRSYYAVIEFNEEEKKAENVELLEL